MGRRKPTKAPGSQEKCPRIEESRGSTKLSSERCCWSQPAPTVARKPARVALPLLASPAQRSCPIPGPALCSEPIQPAPLCWWCGKTAPPGPPTQPPFWAGDWRGGTGRPQVGIKAQSVSVLFSSSDSLRPWPWQQGYSPTVFKARVIEDRTCQQSLIAVAGVKQACVGLEYMMGGPVMAELSGVSFLWCLPGRAGELPTAWHLWLILIYGPGMSLCHPEKELSEWLCGRRCRSALGAPCPGPGRALLILPAGCRGEKACWPTLSAAASLPLGLAHLSWLWTSTPPPPACTSQPSTYSSSLLKAALPRRSNQTPYLLLCHFCSLARSALILSYLELIFSDISSSLGLWATGRQVMFPVLCSINLTHVY